MLRRLRNDSDIVTTELLGAFALTTAFAIRPDGIDAEYDALRTSRTLRSALGSDDALNAAWQHFQTGFVHALRNHAAPVMDDATRLVDVQPDTWMIADTLATLIPDAGAIVVIPNPLNLVADAFEACDGIPERIKDNEHLYRALFDGPKRLVHALAAFAGRVQVVRPGDTDCQDDIGTGDQPPTVIAESGANAPPGWHAFAHDPGFCSIASQYLCHHAETLHALGYDTAALESSLETTRQYLALHSRLNAFDLERIESFGIARATLEAIVRAAPPCSDELPLRQALADVLNNQGEALFAIGNMDAAEHAMRYALTLDPAHAATLNNLGVLAWQRSDPEGAIDHLSRSYASAPDNRNTVVNLVEILLAVGDSERVRQLLNHYLSTHPEDDEIFALALQIGY